MSLLPRPPLIAAAALLAALLPCAPGLGASQEPSAGESGPVVVRLRVPESALSEWFPDRAGLTAIEEGRFEELVRRARAASRDRSASALLRPMRVEHQARFEGGMLVGKTTLRFPDPGDSARWAPLAPWSPAVSSASPASSLLAYGDDGRAFLRLGPDPDGEVEIGTEPGPTRSVELSWTLRPRVEVEGRIFDLELVEGPATALVLDLPEGITPSGPPGYREGPEPTGQPGRHRWRFDGPGGSVVLRLRSSPDPDRPSGPWIGGSTLVELGEAGPENPAGAARWSSTWDIDPGPEGHRPLEIALAPGLSWEDVSGPEGAVASVEATSPADGSGTRLMVRWREGLVGPTRLTLSGLAPVDLPSSWLVPMAEPVGAQWTGGPVFVRLGRSWSLLDCRQRAGRRLDLAAIADLAPTVAEGETLLAFFADFASPVAELALAPAADPCSVTVRGTVLLRDGADTLEAEVDLDPGPRSASLLTLELSPGWLPESIRLADDPLVPRWEQDLLPDGRTRLLVHLPGSIGGVGPRRASLIVSAGVLREEPGSLDLPRLRPIDRAIVDERWSVLAGPGVALRPVEAEGLAWLPAGAPAASPIVPGPEAEGEDGGEPPRPRPLLSWRWIAPEGRGRALREHRAPRPSAVVSQRATIAGGMLAIEWRIQLDGRGQELRSIPYRIVPGPGGLDAPAWIRSGVDGRGERPVPVVSDGGPPELRLPANLDGPISLVGRLELPWDGEGVLPVLHLPRSFESRGTIVLRVDPALRCDLKGDFSFRDAGVRDPSPPADDAGLRPGPTRLAASLFHDGPPGELQVRTASMPGPPAGGVILRADLQTWAADDSCPTRHHLTLDVAGDGSGQPDLGVLLPPGSTPGAVSCDGRPVSPFLQGESIRIPLPRRQADEGAPASSDAPGGSPCRVEIDFEAPPSGDEVQPDRPRFSIPCLSFSWRLAMPAGRSVSATGPALRPMGPTPDRRGWLPGLDGGRLPSPDRIERSMLDRLDEQAIEQPAPGRPIGRVLSSWDVGRWPLVVDRVALEARGIGPETTLPGTPRALPSGGAPPAGPPTSGAARRGISTLGLLIVPVDTVLLVTTLDQVPRFSSTPLGGGASRASWSRAMREAVAWGADRANRFQTVDRWRASPGAFGPAPAGPTGSDARQVLRYISPGWPATGPGSGVRSIDRWPWLVSGAGLGVLLVAVAAVRLAGRGWSALRVVLLVMLVIGSAFSWSRGGPRAAAVAVGVFYGAVVASAIAPIRKAPRASRPELLGSTVTRSHGTGSRIGAVSTLLLATAAALGTAQALPPPEGGDPIVAFLTDPIDDDDRPADGDAGPTLWLRDADLDRLEAASGALPAGPIGPTDRPRIGVTAADHDLTPVEGGSWLLESRLTLRFEEDGPAAWSLPIDRPTGLEAAFDGQPRPVLIGPAAGRATVAIEGLAGSHELVIRQRVRPESDASGLRLSVPINPAATASLTVADSPEAGDPTLPTARGSSSTAPDGRLRSAIGPVDRIEITWDTPGGGGSEATRPRVDGLLLWQALPSADLLDARLTVRGGGAVRELWFAVEPGVAVRSIRATGAIVEGSRIVAQDGDRWVARIDPPLPDGGEVRVELWRPRDEPASTDADEGADPPGVRPPRLEPIGVDRFEGKIALMRPETWGGRLSSSPADLPISEQEFEQEWGPLPRGAALDPAGAARFRGAPAMAVPIGPAAPRRRASPSLQLDLDAGRWEWRLAADVADLDGRSIRELELGIPRELELLDVASPGLTAWDRPSRERLRLRFDGPGGSTRSIAVVGWIPQPSGPMDPGPMVVERPLPWPSWPGASVQPGTLILSSPTTALIGYREADGDPVQVDRLAPSNDRRPYRQIRVDRPGVLQVESFPAVTVEIWSQLTVGDRSARWDALARYEVTGGPADHIELILPEAWLRDADFELDGFGPIRVRNLGDIAEIAPELSVWGTADLLEIVPERPIWGTADLRIRSTRPLEADQPLNFPDLVPWGRGKFSMHTVALVVPTDRSPIVDFSGLEPADAATRLLFDRNLPAELPADSSRSVYSVRLKGWSLAVRPPSGSNDPDGGAPEARVSLADVSGVVAADGTVRGHVAFDLQPSNAPFLVLQAPPGAVCPAAVVDGLPVLPRVPAEGRWAIPLGDGPSRRVELVWIDPGPEDARRAGRRFSIPQPIQDDSAVLITLSCDESHSLNASGGSILPTPAASPLVDRMERAADRIRAKLDPDPPASSAPVSGSVAVADRDALGAEVARLLSLQRQAERSAYWAAVMHPDTAEVVRQRGPLRRIATVRQEIEADLIAAGLPDLIASSSPADDPGPAPNRLAPPLPGIPHHFRAETEANRPITFEWTAEDPR